jgi:hypothetical protein
LNGAWEFRFDPERVGLAEKWFVPSAPQWPDQIIIPFCWESLAAWGEADAAGNDNFFTRVYQDRSTLTTNSAARHVTKWALRRHPDTEEIHAGRRVLYRGRSISLQAWATDRT